MSLRWLVIGVLLLCGLVGFAAWPRTDVVAEVEVAPESQEFPGAGPAQVVLLREWAFFGLRENYTLYAGRGVVVDHRPLTLCGTAYPLAGAGDPPSIQDVTPESSGYEVRFASGEVVTVPDDALTPCR